MSPRFDDLRWINLEPIGACNLRCPHCSRDAKARPQGAMSMALFDKLVAQVPKGCEVRLFLSGEPFLDPDLASRVWLCTRRGLKTLVHTNGTHLTPGKIRGVLDARLTAISVSIDGGSFDEYSEMRPSWSPTPRMPWDGLAELLLQRQKTGAETRIIFQSIRRYPDPLEVMPELRDLAARCDEVYVRHPHNWAQMASVEGAAPPSYGGGVCSFLNVSMSVQSNGLVVPCCACLNQEHVMGDANTTPLREIWDGEHERFRRAQKGGEWLPVCSGCERYGKGAAPGEDV